MSPANRIAVAWRTVRYATVETLNGDSYSGQMGKTCVFCGHRPESKTKEHVIPRWLIQATGDPKRFVSFGTYTLHEKEPTLKTFSFDQLTFPACASCNGDFSRLEASAKDVMERLLARKPLNNRDFDILLDWLDKVRTGMWLGLMWLDGNPWGIKPKFHISQRIGLHDRSLGISFIEGRHPGINLVGPESPCFGLSPTTMCLFINEVGLFNSSTIGLCSRRLGFPFPTDLTLRPDGLMGGWIAPGLERILRPIEPIGPLQLQPFVYQPIFERGIAGSSTEVFETEYVKHNSFDFNNGRGSLFLQHRGVVSKYGEEPSADWVPQAPQSLRQVYRTGRRWAYKKLERYYAEQTVKGDTLPRVFERTHTHLLSMYDREMGSSR